jgi:membrane fusion protein (multidrug efflux system)
MNRKLVIAAVVVVLLAGLVVVALIKSHGEASELGGDETPPTIVTVQTGVLKLATLHSYIAGFGTVETAPATGEQPAAGAQLAAPCAGVVTKVNVIEGQTAMEGDVLMELNSGAMTVANAAQQVERQKELYAQQNTSLKNLQDAEAQLALLHVTAPLSGTVTRVNVKPGQAVDLTTVVAEVMDLNRLAVSAEIPAAEAAALKTGEPVEVSAEPPVTATLSFVSPSVDKNTDTILVRALLPANSGLRPGQFVSLRIVTTDHTDCLVAPAESVVTDESGKSVIALVKSDEAEQTPVQTGLRENGWVEIISPELKAGDTVVTVGAYGLPEKTKISVQNSSGDETSSTNSPDTK